MNCVDIFKALSDETRLRIVNLLLERECCVCEVEYVLGISQPSASRNLNKLRGAQIITKRKDAQWVHYRLTDEFRERYQALLENLAAEVRSRPGYREDLEKLSSSDIRSCARQRAAAH